MVIVLKEHKELTIFDKAIIGIIPFTFALSLILLIVTKNNNSEVKSLILGAAASLIFNYWHIKTSIKISNSINYEKLKAFTIFSYILRYFIYAVLIFIGWRLSNFNPMYIVFGITEYPLIMVIVSISSLRGEKMNA